jgi:hypothetical protein
MRAHALVRDRIPFKAEEDAIPASIEPLRELVRSGALGLRAEEPPT